MKDGGNWSSTVKSSTDGALIDYWYAKPVSMHSFDETVVTIRAKQHNFSFAGREVADGKRIFIRDYGVLLKPVKDATTYADAVAAYQKAQKTVYQKVAELPEQKLERAWSDMPQKGRIYMPVAVEGGRQHFRIRNDANVQISSNWHNRVKGEDSGKCLWPGRELYINFGIPRDNGATTGASIEDGNMPIVTTWYERDGVRYTEDAFATTLVGKLPKEGRVRAEEPQVLMLRFRLTNFGDKPAKITIPIDVKANKAEELVLRDGLIYGKMEQGEALRMYVNANGAASLTANGTQVNCEIGVPSKETREFFINMAFQTLSAPAEIEQLKSLDYTKQHDMIASYWRKRIAQGCQIVTPEPMLNDFYSANITHQLINTENEVGTTERAMPKVGTFYYGVYCNESVMMLSEIDRRGFHDVAQKAYETWLHY
ncbi:MAG: hypothetical protein Q7N50_13815, partial [Armatimonadota bacterium]|nr:hypothetical protein [Armatimonadota bacterium]